MHLFNWAGICFGLVITSGYLTLVDWGASFTWEVCDGEDVGDVGC